MKIGVLDYQIKPTKHLSVRAHNAVKALGGALDHEDVVIEILGLTDPDAQIILIESEAGPDTRAAVLVHEVIHACFAQAGMQDTLTFETEESVTKRLAPLLLQVLRENPKLIRYLTGRWNDRKVVTR